ncbi:MAG: Holliday junction resolvase RuvX, partial [Oscillospiraceae bacterium]|nr:Holliday junction resolvase RuvX [Oscillospiraceae bacterium]
ITDELGITAQGLTTIHYNGNDKVLLADLDRIMSENQVDTIVVGMPYNMDGTKTVRAEKTEKFMHKLRCKYNKIKIEQVDERLTTVQANRTMVELNINKNKKKNIRDTMAATYILETYMNRLNMG